MKLSNHNVVKLDTNLIEDIYGVGFSKDEIIMIQNRLNHRPRKMLNYKTPYEVFFSEISRRLAS